MHTISLLDSQLETFMAVANHASMHGAARVLHLSQTAVTQRIHALETKLSTTLFIRNRQGVILTSEGESLLRYCKTVADLSGETLAKICGGGVQSTIRLSISGPTSIMMSRIIPQCLKVMNNYKQLFIDINIDDTEEAVISLRNGKSQFAILEPKYVSQEMQYKILKPECYHLVCSAQWKKRKLHEIIEFERIIDFSEQDEMTFNYLKHFNLFKFANLERLFVNRTESLAKMIMQEYGYGVLTEEFSLPYKKCKALSEKSNSIHISLDANSKIAKAIYILTINFLQFVE